MVFPAAVVRRTAGRKKNGLMGRRHISELDGFRAIAVLWVLLHHALYGWTHAVYGWTDAQHALEGWPKLVTFVLHRGWLGVDLFFVLSGFLITGILLDSRVNEHYWKHFYARRALRILPVYLAVVLVYALFYRGYGPYFGLSLVMVANLAGFFGVPVPHGPGVFWSLSVEEHFYMIWPLMVWLLSRRKLAILAAALVVMVPIARGLGATFGVDPEAIYSYSWFRFDGLALGALMATWVRSSRCTQQKSFYVVTGLIAAAILITIGGWPFGLMKTATVASTALRYTQVQLIFAAAILASVTMQGSSWTAPLRSRFARITSNYSYCMYLIHLAVGDAFMYWFGPGGATAVNLGPSAFLLLRLAVMLAASYAVAAMSYRFLEQPCLRLKRYFDDKPQRKPAETCSFSAS